MALCGAPWQRGLRRQKEALEFIWVSGSRFLSSSADIDELEDAYPTTPWVRSVISGVDLMRNAKVSSPGSSGTSINLNNALLF